MTDADLPPSEPPAEDESGNAILAPLTASPNYLFLPPRIGIIHLLAWITVMAAFLSFYKTGFQTLNKPIELNYWTWIGLFNLAITSAGFVGCGILLGTKIRHMPGYFQPGHWMIIFACINALITIFYTIIYLVSSPETPGAFSFGINYFRIAQGIALCWIVLRLFEFGRWRIFFIILAVVLNYRCLLEILDFLNYRILFFDLSILSYYVHYWWIPLAIETSFAIYLIAVVIHDVIHGPRRDWLHWMGIGMFFWEEINPILNYLLSMLE